MRRDGLSMIHVDNTPSCILTLGSFRFKHFTDVCLCALSFMQQTSVCAHSLC